MATLKPKADIEAQGKVPAASPLAAIRRASSLLRRPEKKPRPVSLAGQSFKEVRLKVESETTFVK
jgi:hypothetical protein